MLNSSLFDSLDRIGRFVSFLFPVLKANCTKENFFFFFRHLRFGQLSFFELTEFFSTRAPAIHRQEHPSLDPRQARPALYARSVGFFFFFRPQFHPHWHLFSPATIGEKNICLSDRDRQDLRSALGPRVPGSQRSIPANAASPPGRRNSRRRLLRSNHRQSL